jgi:hypothetical protein
MCRKPPAAPAFHCGIDADSGGPISALALALSRHAEAIIEGSRWGSAGA